MLSLMFSICLYLVWCYPFSSRGLEKSDVLSLTEDTLEGEGRAKGNFSCGNKWETFYVEVQLKPLLSYIIPARG